VDFACPIVKQKKSPTDLVRLDELNTHSLNVYHLDLPKDPSAKPVHACCQKDRNQRFQGRCISHVFEKKAPK
jgi:hypothetical protein